MQPKEPIFDRPAFDREESAESPALARRRRLLGGQAAAVGFGSRAEGEPRQPTLLPESELESAAPEADPNIPPLPVGASLREAGAAPIQSSRMAPPRAGQHRLLYFSSAAAVLLIVLGWWLLPGSDGAGDGSAPPLVLAEEGPEKVRPQEEGGMEVPNQDILVYNELTGTRAPAEPEVLLPGPESPMAPPTAPAQAAVAAGGQTPAEALPTPVVPAPEGDVAPAAGAETTASPPPAPADPAKQASSSEPDSATPPEKKPAQTAAAGGGFRVQLAAVKSADAAKAAWAKMTKAHPEILEGLSLRIDRVDRGSEGTLYRVQGGPLADRAAANAVCGHLKQKSQPCLVVAP